MRGIEEQVIPSAHDREHLDERRLVDAARTGCDESFAVLSERYHPQLLRYFVHQTGDHELAADLTQETLLDAFRRLDRLTDDRTFIAWLYRIAHYNLLHEWRRQRLLRLISLDWLLAEGGASKPALQTSDGIVVSHERDLIQQVLNKLSPSLREALLLYSLCGFSSQDVANILNISPAAARQRISRAKQEFRQRYHTYDGGTYAPDPALR